MSSSASTSVSSSSSSGSIYDNYIKPTIESSIKTFRLIPFVIVSYYLISAIFAGNFKMFILFVGLIFSTLLVMAVSKVSYSKIYGEETVEKVIDLIKSYSIFNLGGVKPLSFLPLSLNIYAFLLCYYLYVSFANKKKTEQEETWRQNWGIIIALVILLALDMAYFGVIFKEKISTATMVILIPTVLGAILGVVWPILIGKSNWAVSIADTNSTCSPSGTTYKCNLTTDGTLM